jgi:hypothetical protein
VVGYFDLGEAEGRCVVRRGWCGGCHDLIKSPKLDGWKSGKRKRI